MYKRQEHNDGWESESIADLSGWSVQLGGGAGRQDAVTWVAPSRWTPTQTGLFLDAVGGLDPHSVEPNSVAACVSGLLKARGAVSYTHLTLPTSDLV